MGLTRRLVIGSGLSFFCQASLSRAAGARDAFAAVADLRSYIVEVSGRPDLARAAIARDRLSSINSLSDESLLVEIAAIGTLVRTGTKLNSLREGYHERGRRAIERAREVWDNVAWAKALEGAWHFEVMHRSRLGGLFFGASEEEGSRLFKAARRLDPRDRGLGLAEVVSLLTSKSDTSASQAMDVLETLGGGTDNAYERLITENVVALSKSLRSSQIETARAQSQQIF